MFSRTDGTEPNLDGEELSWGSFHTRKELRRAVAEGELTLQHHQIPAGGIDFSGTFGGKLIGNHQNLPARLRSQKIGQTAVLLL